MVTNGQIIIELATDALIHRNVVGSATANDDICTSACIYLIISVSAAGICCDKVQRCCVGVFAELKIEATKIAQHQVISKLQRSINVCGNAVCSSAAHQNIGTVAPRQDIRNAQIHVLSFENVKQLAVKPDEAAPKPAMSFYDARIVTHQPINAITTFQPVAACRQKLPGTTCPCGFTCRRQCQQNSGQPFAGQFILG